MAGKTLTRADLAEAVYRKVGLSRTESAELVEIGARRDLRGDRARRNREAFVLRHLPCARQERAHRPQPKTGEEVPILPRRVMTFKASNVLKNRILRTHQTARPRPRK